jgi:hypothetical protein
MDYTFWIRAKYHAQALADAANLAYWAGSTVGSYDHHERVALDALHKTASELGYDLVKRQEPVAVTADREAA